MVHEGVPLTNEEESEKEIMSINKLPEKYRSFQEAGEALRNKQASNATHEPPTLPPVPPELVPKKQKYKQRTERILVEPEYLIKLRDRLGSSSAVAKTLGVSEPHISSSIKGGEIAIHYELAAQAIWMRDHEPKPEPEKVVVSEVEPVLMRDNEVFVSMRIDRGAWEAVKGWLKEAGAVTRVF